MKYCITICELAPEDGGGYVAYHPDLGWAACSGVGDTIMEAISGLEINFKEFAAVCAADGLPLPAPAAPPYVEKTKNIKEKNMDERIVHTNLPGIETKYYVL
jgi:predicted RNase H-like HicB family nuclease